MRQGFFAAAAFAAGLLALSPAQAASKSTHSASTGSSSPKIAVVDVQAVLKGCQRGREAFAVLTQKQSDLEAQAKDMNEKRKAYKDQLDKADQKSSDYPKLLKQFQDEDTQYSTFVNDSRQLLQQRQQELFQPIEQELQTVVTQYFKDNHIDILLGGGAGSVLVTDQYNATQGVIDAMDKDWAVIQKSQPAPAAAPAPAASTKGPSH
ncbi:MAG TPA: OmpH family outer membrane protein [Gammaproteobacteria bacterium]|jgi:Skp family chaperone for outer membrane proteins